MNKPITQPIYEKIALDIASRIVRGELKENSKIYGRSVMSSEYGVSPETIRRALKLLADMEIVNILHNSGTIILSREKAGRYIERFGEYNDLRAMQKKLRALIGQQEQLNRQMEELTGSIISTSDRFSNTNPFQNYEIDVRTGTGVIGRTLGELRFWQQTGATVIAIRRDDKIILSPGPYAELKLHDTLIFVGDIASVSAVEAMLAEG